MESRINYSLIVFSGACSYGILSTVIKLSYWEGYYSAEIIGSQYFFGWVFLSFASLFLLKRKVTWKNKLSLMTVGITALVTGSFYAMSLHTIPASIAVVLLFQFTWIGILLGAVMERTFPSKSMTP